MLKKERCSIEFRLCGKRTIPDAERKQRKAKDEPR